MRKELVFSELAAMFGIIIIAVGIIYGFSGRYNWGSYVIYPHLLEGALFALIGGIYASIGLIGYYISTTLTSGRICPSCGKNLSNLSEDIKSCPYCTKTLPEIRKTLTTPQVTVVFPEEYPKPLIEKYATMYPHNPKGVLEFHISKKVKEGKTKQQAIEELVKENQVIANFLNQPEPSPID